MKSNSIDELKEEIRITFNEGLFNIILVYLFVSVVIFLLLGTFYILGLLVSNGIKIHEEHYDFDNFWEGLGVMALYSFTYIPFVALLGILFHSIISFTSNSNIRYRGQTIMKPTDLPDAVVVIKKTLDLIGLCVKFIIIRFKNET